MAGFSSLRAVQALTPSAGFGAIGRFVQLIQARLSALHIYVPQTGVYDQQTGLALDAYHRLLGRGTSQSLDGATISALLDDRGAFVVRNPRDGKHGEGNLGRQLLALINGSKVYRIYPISSGKPSTPTIPRPLPGLSAHTRVSAGRDVLLELLLRGLRDPRL